jgi:hypothetical protein
MKALIPIMAAGLLIVPGAALAQGASNVTPGHEMQQKGSHNAPGASYYAPGHEKKQQNLKDPDHDHDVDTKTRR